MPMVDALAASPRPAARAAWVTIGQGLLRGAGAALLAGLLVGLVARGLMRLAALAAGEESEFTVVGTAMILVFFGVAMVPGAVARTLGARRTAVVLLVLGDGLVAFAAAMIASSDLAGVTLTPGTTAAVVALAAGFALTAVTLGMLAWRFASWWAPRR